MCKIGESAGVPYILTDEVFAVESGFANVALCQQDCVTDWRQLKLYHLIGLTLRISSWSQDFIALHQADCIKYWRAYGTGLFFSLLFSFPTHTQCVPR